MNLPEILSKMQKEDGMYSENDVKDLERLTGMSWKEIQAKAKEQQPEIPDGNPASWPREQKLSFIGEHGRKKYQNLIDERK